MFDPPMNIAAWRNFESIEMPSADCHVHWLPYRSCAICWLATIIFPNYRISCSPWKHSRLW